MEDEQEAQENVQAEEETYQEVEQEDSVVTSEPIEQEDSVVTSEPIEQNTKRIGDKNPTTKNLGEDRTNFFQGVAVGLGIGCIATFVIVWISVFFAPRMPSGVTYENLLSIFVYPLMYLLAVGLIALTAGIVREYYSRSRA